MPSDVVALGRLVVEALRQLTVLPSDPALRLAVYSAMALAALTLVVMLNVLVLAELAARRERRRAAFSVRWRPLLTAWSLNERAALPPLGRRRHEERLWLLLMWANLQRQVRGNAKEYLNAFFDHLAMDAYVTSMLNTRQSHRKLLALACLRHLGEERHWGDVAPLVSSSNPVESLAAADALVAMNPPRAMRFLVPFYIQRNDWAYLRFKSLCKQAGREAAGPALLAALKQSSHPRIVALIEWITPIEAAPWARQSLRKLPASAELTREQRDAVCASLRCLAELHSEQDRELIEQAFDHPFPQVRSEAVLALKHQSSRGDEKQFTRMLSDPSWWVRQAAADALVDLPTLETARLEALLDSLQDRYGRDALRRAIAEKR